MDRLDAMHMFVRVVETGSFTKVAQEFATTQFVADRLVEAGLNPKALPGGTGLICMWKAFDEMEA